MKKILFSLLAFAVGFPLASAEFSDTHGKTSRVAVDYLQGAGVVQGFDDGTFKPENQITRAEFLKIALKSVMDEKEFERNVFPSYFSDVNPSDWHYTYVMLAADNEIIKGYDDGTFRPNDPIIFRDAAKIISEVHDIEVPENAGEEWFSGYVSAIERERVLPGSINDTAEKLSRGEMSEIVWGIVTGHEVENTKFGELPEVKSCEELTAQVHKFEKRNNMRYRNNRYYDDFDLAVEADGVVMESESNDDVRAEKSVGTSAPVMEAKEEGAAGEYSTTNVQEFGVDEADIIKNDGSHVFMIKGNTIRIVDAYPAADLEQIAVIGATESGGFTPREMYLDGDKLVVIGQTWGNKYPQPILYDEEISVKMIAPPEFGVNSTQVIVIDVSDRNNPERLRTVSFQGNYVSSRKVGDVVYPVITTHGWYPHGSRPILREQDMPKFEDSTRSEEEYLTDCTGVKYVPNFVDSSMLTLAAIDIQDLSQKVDREVVLGGGNQIYASTENMYITRSIWDELYLDTEDFVGWMNMNLTEIYKFELDGADVSFKAKGEVEGNVLNQFSMSEYDGYFRVATQSRGGSLISILDRNLSETGVVRGIAPGESIKSARFVGKRGYLVTFKNVDPLFVIDLTPTNPKILGELKIPGWTDYIHPYDENHLIGFGREVDPAAEERGRLTSTDLMGMKISLFDVSDTSNPLEVQKLVIGERGTNSPLLYTHKALLFDKNKGIFAFPVTVTEIDEDNPNQYNNMKTVFSGAHVYNFDLENGFELRGEMTHYESDEWFTANNGYFYGDPERTISRVIYIGDNFYSISPNFVKAWSMDEVEKVSEVQFDEKPCNQMRNQFECTIAPSCDPVVRVTTSECKGNGDDRVCEDFEQFLRCEEK